MMRMKRPKRRRVTAALLLRRAAARIAPQQTILADRRQKAMTTKTTKTKKTSKPSRPDLVARMMEHAAERIEPPKQK
ncbi:hypothetical protein [Ciceribacter azotifigens]|uniref:hypothetical protein n=1 Tax=Ciceribacter azotifigens TaxID=2069303 RepID=UPI003A8AA64D